MPHRSRPRRHHPRLLAALVAPALLATAAACGSAAPSASSASQGRPTVVASFYPLAWLAERVGGRGAAVERLTKPGTEPHDLELTPHQVIDVAKADLVLYVKGMQPAVDEAVDQHGRGHSLDAASVVEVLPAPGGGEDEHAAYDPHLWLDPVRFAAVARKVGDRLAAVDPDHAAGYRKRAGEVVGELTALDEAYRSGLRTCRVRTFITSHAAFGYLAQRYHLRQVAMTGIDPEVEPSPTRLAEVARRAKEEHVKVIFFERLASPKLAGVLAHEVGAKAEVLDPIEGATGSSDYLSLMRANLTALRGALGCW